ncbi:site-specific DNA-methyltransferase [Acinetobacter soli]|uniref:DNA-methyltransferase n=1 Tax=Acinetobacter soli TaxID=487316 RepID=UPI001C0AB645|nr:site-specific DNA-methyltransferase [Acinetobacter soli]MBU3121353.1 site-specific DNA-methyltransferase [Acinetobacter soli]
MYEVKQGDCLELMKSIEDNSINLILADLPYGVTECEWDQVIPFSPLWSQYERIISPNGAIILFSMQPFTAALINSNTKIFRYELIWEKPAATGFLNAKIQPLRAHENILVFYKRTPTYNPIKTTGHKRQRATRRKVGSAVYGKQLTNLDYDSTERYPRSVLCFSNDRQKSSIHPTQKPVALCEYLIKTYSNKGDTVLDNVMGSASTGVACINTERHFIGFEKNEQYFTDASERLRLAQYEFDHGVKQQLLFEEEDCQI